MEVFIVEQIGPHTARVYSTLERAKGSCPDVTWALEGSIWCGIPEWEGEVTIRRATLDPPSPTGT